MGITVWFFTIVYDNLTQKVLEIIKFWVSWKIMEMHFIMSNSRDFSTRIWTLSLMKKCCANLAKNHHFQQFSAQKISLCCSYFLANWARNIRLVSNLRETFTQGYITLRMKSVGFSIEILMKSRFKVQLTFSDIEWAFQLRLFQKLLQNTFHLRPIWCQ